MPFWLFSETISPKFAMKDDRGQNVTSAIDVVGAVIRDGGRVLLAQRPEGKAQAGLWEFPGGKIEPGETPAEALARECREELAVAIEEPRLLASVVHHYPEKTVRLVLMECRLAPGFAPVPQEHQQVAWVAPEQLPAMDLCPADRELLPALRAVPRPPRRSASRTGFSFLDFSPGSW